MQAQSVFGRSLWRLCAAGALLLAVLSVMPARAATDLLYVSATGHYVRGAFRDYWDTHGGMANFGYPLTEEYVDPQTNRVYQYFERARFERTTPSASVVELGMLGRLAAGSRVFATAAPITSTKQRRYFPETKHIVQYGFKEIFEARGGVAVFGLPISEEINERLADGTSHSVQYFERARFEFWPNLPAGQRVLLSLLGRQFVPPALTAPLAPNAPPVAPAPPAAPVSAAPPLVRPILPASKNAQVLPQAGQPGDTFFFSANGFKPGEKVGIWLNSPDGAIIGARFQATADQRGSIDAAQIAYGTGEESPLGIWSFVAQGVDSNNASVGYFLLIESAIGRLPQAAQPGPGVPPNVDARVEPSAGKAGTIFFFSAAGFKSGEDVTTTIFASDGTKIEVNFTTKADDKGGIGYAGLYYVTEPYFPMGLWKFVAQGKTSGKVSTSYFVLTP